MKKALLVVFIMMLAMGGSAWWLLRSRTAAFSLDQSMTSFSADNLGAGRLFRYVDGGRPLRAFRWLRPSAGGIEVAQVLTQTDQQQVGIFQDGLLSAQVAVPRPEGVAEGFYRFAQLRDAAVVPGNVVVLLYRAQDATSADVPLIIALDLNSQSVRWSHRAAVDHLALALDPDRANGKADDAVIGYGDNGELVRLPLHVQKGEREGAKAPRAAAQSIPWPPEIQGVTDLIPTGQSSLLVSHRMGLSAYLGEAGWNHLSLPAPGPLGFVEPKSSLATDGKKIWWQPEPGRLIQVKVDGTPLAMWEPRSMPIPAPFEKDAELLRLLGADSEGKLWFGLATPTLLQPLKDPTGGDAQAPAPPTTPALDPSVNGNEGKPASSTGGESTTAPAPLAPQAPQAAEGIDRGAWEAYLRQGLDRVYCWDPQNGAIRRASWSECWRKLGPPSDFSMPLDDGALRPAAGGFLFGSGTDAWWLPLRELPLVPAGTSGKALPPPTLEPLVVKAPPMPMTDFSGLPGTPKN